MNNTPECLEQIPKIQIILDKIALLNYRRRGSSDLLDTICLIQNSLDNQKSINLPVHIDENKENIRFNFWIYYNELDEFNTNEVIISKDLKTMSIDITYGSFHFYEKYYMKSNVVEKEHLNNKKYYPMSLVK